MKDYIIRKIGTNIQIKVFDVMLYSTFNGLSIKQNYKIQLLVILGKFHIHKSKWTSLKPSFHRFIVELKQYCTSIEYVKNSKAAKTFCILKEMNFV